MVNFNNNITTSYITEDTVIKGDVISSGNIILEGVVSGAVSSNGTVDVKSGSVGGINAENIKLSSCEIKGNLKSTDAIFVDEATTVIGDIEAHNIKVLGNINGRLSVDDKVELFSSCSVKGDIVAGNIAIEEGAIIDGKLSVVRK